MADFDLGDLYSQAFGYQSDAFKPSFSTVTGDTTSDFFRKEYGDFGSPYYGYDANGREYFLPVTLTYDDETTTVSTIFGASHSGALKSWELPNPVISISSRKTIIETPLTERTGTVKELINIQGYEISIKGFIIAATNEFPEEDVKTMKTLYESSSAVQIDCPLTDIAVLFLRSFFELKAKSTKLKAFLKFIPPLYLLSAFCFWL